MKLSVVVVLLFVIPYSAYAEGNNIGKEAICPVLGNKFTITQETRAVDYKGETYYFCCPNCVSKFISEPEKYINEKASEKAPPKEENNFTIGGEGKIRFRYVKADTDTVKGTYGETLAEGFNFGQRIDLFLNIPLTEYISINSALRISNEDSQDVLPPPDFISMKALAGWWSLNFTKHPFEAIVGSYDASFTPLTFMRWDLKDNLLTSGSCCQVSVGGISGESLEEPKEDYKIEGVKTEMYGEYGDMTVLFARPQVAKERETYAKYMYGTRCRFIFPFMKHFSSLNIGGTYLRVKDDMESVKRATAFPLQSDVFGVDFVYPVWRALSCVAEYAKSTRDDNLLGDDPFNPIRIDEGFIGGLRLLSSGVIDANLLYLKLGPYFSPLYKALSYARNNKGFRFSCTYRKLELFSKLLTVSAYLKKLDEIKPTDISFGNISIITDRHHSLSSFLTGSLGVNIAIFDDWKIEGDYEYRETLRADDIEATIEDETIDTHTGITSLILTYEFTMQSKIMFKYQLINNVDKVGNGDYKANIPMLYFSVKF